MYRLLDTLFSHGFSLNLILGSREHARGLRKGLRVQRLEILALDCSYFISDRLAYRTNNKLCYSQETQGYHSSNGPRYTQSRNTINARADKCDSGKPAELGREK